MTRAKERVYFIADKQRPSAFVTEISEHSTNEPALRCPECGTGNIVERSGVTKGRLWAFKGCEHFIYGCEFKEWQ